MPENTAEKNEEKTTISISFETKKLLDEKKVHPREPYDELLNRLLKNNKVKEA